METGIQNHTEVFAHEASKRGVVCLCPEMLEVAEEACRAGVYDFTGEIYASQLADFPQLDRGLCLRKADALARCGRIAEALDFYCVAAKRNRLWPDELGHLVESIARSLREKELVVGGEFIYKKSVKSNSFQERGANTNCKSSGGGGIEGFGDVLEDKQSLDLFSCCLCKYLLSEPATLQCGHTFCKRCLEDDSVTECTICKFKLRRKNGQSHSIWLTVNVILCSLLDKWFDSESKARRSWQEGQHLWKKGDLSNALEKYDKAVELVPSDCSLIGQRAELHIEMKNFTQAIQDGDSMCRLRPLWPKAHCTKAAALTAAGLKEEALQEYLLCVALWPEWSSAKLEAQKILSEMFSLVFERDGLLTPLRPHQAPPLSLPLKSSFLLGSLCPTTHSHSLEAGSSQSQGSGVAQCDGISSPGGLDLLKSQSALSILQSSFKDTQTLTSILSGLPAPPSLKRKCPSDPLGCTHPPTKVLKPGVSCVPVQSGVREVPPQSIDSADMECPLCMRLFYEPVATPCGHTFCLKCLERCLDHNPSCPLCKQSLSEYLATRGYQKTVLLEEILQRFLSEELNERKRVHEDELKELKDLNQEVPIFVCTMAFPTIPCPLHVYEPRYRLMIRRSMETGTRRFGMCIADELNQGFADFGCMLEVRDVKLFPDGRSVVDTVGVSRFRVLSHGLRDGYHTAKIQHLEDHKVEGEQLTELVKLQDSVYEQAAAWFSSLKENLKTQILSHFGNLPAKDPDPQGSPDGPAWAWWLVAVLPLESRAQLTILSMTSLKDRLHAVRRVLLFVSRKRLR
ncbi:LON peptidase N-terminal domain and RING finger protein 2-like isoform X2 [Conger conger]|uniref:LON peptidase N-terminal domain and RING finger protein 2-like isoform X2 n=1 Tax=Conger conger TaxID=82655 RepID=UPI002A5A044E|nr:LON peptidase N-terminal domain and RING finger protein 2-like isoform X2 [Conger conger]